MKKKIIICIILLIVLIATIIGLIGIDKLYNKKNEEPEVKETKKDNRKKLDDYTSTNYEETKKILEEKGYSVEVIKIQSEEAPKNTVLNTLPNPNELVEDGQKIFLYVSEGNEKALSELKYNELMNKLKNKESFILVLSQSGCGHCARYKPVLKEVLDENNITAFYLELDLLNDNEKNNMRKIFDFQVTPTTVFIVNGKEDGEKRFTGAKDKKTIESILRNYEYIE